MGLRPQLQRDHPLQGKQAALQNKDWAALGWKPQCCWGAGWNGMGILPTLQRSKGGQPHESPWKSPSTFPAVVFPLSQGHALVAGGGRHFGECVYRASAKPQEVPAPGDEEQEEKEEEEAKALSNPLHHCWQTKPRAQHCCYAEIWEIEEWLNPSLLDVLSHSSSENEVCQQREMKASGKYIALPPIRRWLCLDTRASESGSRGQTFCNKTWQLTVQKADQRALNIPMKYYGVSKGSWGQTPWGSPLLTALEQNLGSRLMAQGAFPIPPRSTGTCACSPGWPCWIVGKDCVLITSKEKHFSTFTRVVLWMVSPCSHNWLTQWGQILHALIYLLTSAGAQTGRKTTHLLKYCLILLKAIRNYKLICNRLNLRAKEKYNIILLDMLFQNE